MRPTISFKLECESDPDSKSIVLEALQSTIVIFEENYADSIHSLGLALVVMTLILSVLSMAFLCATEIACCGLCFTAVNICQVIVMTIIITTNGLFYNSSLSSQLEISL